MNLKFKLTLILILILNVSIFAQDGYLLSGTVTGADNVPIPGANVIVQNTSRGASTDFDGKFELEVKNGEVLEISSLGFTTKKITITGQNNLTIVLVEDANQLEEVVVVGYGTVKKSDITGSVSSVDSEELTAYPVLNAEQALQGRTAGVVVQSNNGGEPGAPINVKIRGNTSIGANSSPLVVVDGFVGASMPQADDIQSMEILKDASATAIYGSRGANGVILVTTKKGRSGQLNVEANATYSTSNTSNKLDLLNAEDFTTYQNQIRANKNNSTPYTNQGAETDWQDEIYTPGSTQNYQVNFSGGTEKINFYASGTYFNQDGIIINSGFKKLAFLSNIDAQISNKIKLGMNLTGSRSNKDGVATQSNGSVTVGGDDVISLAMRFAPDLPIILPNGTYSVNRYVGDPVDNPWAVATQRTDETVADDFRANLYLNYDILENLTFKSTFGFATQNASRGVYQPSTLIITASGVGGRASIQNNKNTSTLSENYLTYKHEWENSALTVLGGYSYQKNVYDYSYSEGTGIISDSFIYWGLGTATGLIQPEASTQTVEIQSLFGRVNYDLNDKYLFTATVRRDGASNFAENNKYATFPSGAFAWKVSNEDFLKENNTISSLKLRLSYGATGNPSIEPYQSLAKLESLYASSNGNTVAAVTPEQPANPDLKWETSYQGNIGFDVSFLNSAINFTMDFYNIDTKDLILGNTGTPVYFGYSNDQILTNLGEINNKGYEITLNTRNISNDNFRWTTDFNFSSNKNKVVSLVNGADIYGNAAPSYFSVARSYVLRQGEEVGLFWGYDYAGVYQGGAYPEGTATLAGGVAGDPLFKDLDESGTIGEDDKGIIGNPNQDFDWGITNTFTYKDFDLNIFFQGSAGGEIFNMTNVQLNNGDANTTYDYFNNAWTPTNTDTDQPRVGNNSWREISSRFVENGSYARLKNIALGYNLPAELAQKAYMQNVRFSISAQNLWTITKYSGLDPEVNYYGASGTNNTSANTVKGFDFGNYPTIKSLTFSLNLKF
jgi:TonB-linked SusC/RagA family outer membrane protein